MKALERRVERLETASTGADVGLEELIEWSYRRGETLSDADQRRYDDYQRRCETSPLVRRIAEVYGRGEADRLVRAQRPTSVDHPIGSESVPEPATAFAATPSPEDAAIAFLKAKLGDGEPHPVVQVHADADAAGVDLDALHRARNMLPIETRSRAGRPSTWTVEVDDNFAPAPTVVPAITAPTEPVIEDASPRPTIGSGRASAPEMDVSARIAAQQHWLSSEVFVVRNDIGVLATNTGNGTRK